MTPAPISTPNGRSTSAATLDESDETVVARWIDSFNHGDLAGMLDCVADAVAFHPLRLGGLRASYRGRSGMTEWFAEFQRRHHEHRISLSEIRRVDDTQVLAAGSLNFEGAEVGSFCGLHRVADRRICVMHHYLSDPDMIEQLGLIP